MVQPLADKLVTSVVCGGSFAIALGQTLKGTKIDMFAVNTGEPVTRVSIEAPQ
jgi:hypothetical protein